jgi:hypothetical protein
MIRLTLVRGFSAVFSLALLFILSKFFNSEITDNIYIDMSLLMANTILLTFGFDKKIWKVTTLKKSIYTYNIWFQFILLILLPFVIYSLWIDKFLIGVASLILSFIFIISWELQGNNKKYISTVLFTLTVPLSFLFSFILIHLFNLDFFSYVYFILFFFCIIMIYSIYKSDTLNLNHKFNKVNFKIILNEIIENSLIVVPAYLASYTIYLLLEKTSLQSPGDTFEYSGIVRIMAGINILSYALNRYTINSTRNSKISIISKKHIFLTLSSLLYIIILYTFSDYISQIFNLNISSVNVLSLVVLNILISYILTQKIFYCVSKNLFKEIAFSSIFGSVSLIISLYLLQLDLLILAFIVLLGNILRLTFLTFLIKNK